MLRRVDWMSKTNPDLNSLINTDGFHQILLEAIDANIEAANGNRTRWDEFRDRQNPISEGYDSQFAMRTEKLKPLIKLVASSFQRWIG